MSLSDQHSFPLEVVFGFLNPATVTHVLTQALLDSPMFGARWKWNASRALAVPRFSGGRKVPPPLQRMRSDDLLASVFPDQAACAENLTGEIRIPDHPLVNETISNCLHEAMDLDGLIEILDRMGDGTLRTVAIDTREPSPLSHEILNANPYAFLDDAPLEERRTRAVQLRRTLPQDARELGTLDVAAIQQVGEETWPVVRDEHELHDALLTLIVVPPVSEWQGYFDTLVFGGRALVLDGRWVATERLAVAETLPDEAAVVAVLRGWMDSIGPVTPAALAARLGLPEESVQIGLAQLEGEGLILRGKFTGDQEEFCHRRILARIHRMTLGRLRREIEPRDIGRFHAVSGALATCGSRHAVARRGWIATRAAAIAGLRNFGGGLETSVLPRRIAKYEPELLDRLCLAGEVMWGRLSPHPALETASGRKVRPTRVAPLAIFLREDAAKLLPAARTSMPLLSHAASDVFKTLESRGALFFAEIVRMSSRLQSEVEDGLWELVAAGLVTGDGFENLRALIDPRRRRGEGRGRSARPRHAAGRWALMPRETGDRSQETEFFAQLLLTRWGIVFRDMLARESLAPPWRELLQVYRRMEARGEIRGGRFVAGFLGEQFARPEALDLMRHIRRSEKAAESVDVAAADPLNLTGIILPGARTGSLDSGAVRIVEAFTTPRTAVGQG